MRRYRVRFARAALEDLEQLTAYLIEQSPERAHQMDPIVRDAVEVLRRLPFVGRPARQQNDPTLRELLVFFGTSGYILLYRVGPGALVSVLAARHQLEEKFY